LLLIRVETVLENIDCASFGPVTNQIAFRKENCRIFGACSILNLLRNFYPLNGG
jgi:hypothetical protein